MIANVTVGVTVATVVGWPCVLITSIGAFVPETVRLLRLGGPKHGASSLKSSREQFKNTGHGRFTESRFGSQSG